VYAVRSVRSTRRTQYAVRSTQYAVRSTQYAVHAERSTQYAVHAERSTQYAVRSTQYTNKLLPCRAIPRIARTRSRAHIMIPGIAASVGKAPDDFFTCIVPSYCLSSGKAVPLYLYLSYTTPRCCRKKTKNN
jgi:hypothetical protein